MLEQPKRQERKTTGKQDVITQLKQLNIKYAETPRKDWACLNLIKEPAMIIQHSTHHLRMAKECTSLFCKLCTFKRKCVLSVTQSGNSNVLEVVKMWILKAFNEQMFSLQ